MFVAFVKVMYLQMVYTYLCEAFGYNIHEHSNLETTVTSKLILCFGLMLRHIRGNMFDMYVVHTVK
jgi:hypothetical protein